MQIQILVKNKLSSRITIWLLLTQEHDVHKNHIDGSSNLFTDTLPRVPRFDDMWPTIVIIKSHLQSFVSLWIVKYQLQNHLSL